VDRVDVVPTDLGTVLVRVEGRWEGPAVAVRLAVGSPERRFHPLAETSQASARVAAGEGALRATFSVSDDLRRAVMTGEMRLLVGERAVALPAPSVPPEDEAEETAGATVVDRAVLAERRARRAELAEEANARRAAEAERALRDLESELAKLELRLERAESERATLEERVAEQTRAARAADQRAHAERRRREEALEEAATRTAESEDAARRLGERLEAAQDRATTLSREAESLRRRVAEAEQAAAAAHAGRRRAEEAAGRALEEARRQARAEVADALEAARAQPGRPVADAAPPGPLARPRLDAGRLRAESALARRASQAAAPRPAPPAVAPADAHALLAAEQRLSRVPSHASDAEPHTTVAAAYASLATAHQAIAAAQRSLREEQARRRASEATLEPLRRQLSRERDLVATLTRERDAARAELERRAAVQDRAERAVEELRARLEQLQREAAATPDEDELRDFVATTRAALQDAERRISEAHRAAAEAEDELERERAGLRRALDETRDRLRAELEARAADAENGLTRPTPDRSQVTPAAGERIAAATPAAEAAEPEARDLPWLAVALPAFAAQDPGRFARLAVQLLPGQAIPDGPLDYDLHVPGLGWHAVTLRGQRGSVAPLEQHRPRGRVDFRLAVDAPALAALLARGGRAARVAGRAQVRGTLRRRRALRSVPPAQLRLGELARLGVWPDPGLVLAALARLVEPAWTAGHEFAIALEIVGPRGGRWHVAARDGEPLRVGRANPPHPPDATVRMSQAAFQQLLGAAGERPERKAAIRGDFRAVAQFVAWTERARSQARKQRD
jgi:hypothetical protein